MKKSKFAHLNLEGVEVLSREQMSKVKGGYWGYGGGGSDCGVAFCSDRWNNMLGSVNVACDCSNDRIGCQSFYPETYYVQCTSC